MLFCDWVLGNFSNVEEVKQSLKTVKVFGYDDPEYHMDLTIHFIVYDATGSSIVIEYNFGTYEVYDNELGIMTNAPDFPYHVSNLRNFIGMNNFNPPAHKQDGMDFLPTGHGAGMWGLPGDYTPPSRFIRFGVLTNFSDQQPDAPSTLNLAQHIINTFSIPRGIIAEKTPDNKVINETTQWVSFRDLTNKVLYFNTYDNQTIRKIELGEIDFGKTDVLTYPFDKGEQTIIDVTADMKANK